MELRLLLLLLAVGCAVGAGMGDVPTQCWTQYLAAGPTGLDSLHTTQAMARRELAELRSLGCPQTSHPSVIVTLAPVSHPSSQLLAHGYIPAAKPHLRHWLLYMVVPVAAEASAGLLLCGLLRFPTPTCDPSRDMSLLGSSRIYPAKHRAPTA